MKQLTQTSNRQYKARLFEMIFSQPETCLQLYNAVNGTDYDNPDLLEINTLENAIYMSMRNDISFIIDSRLSLYEHQSTNNPNLPVRQLMYIADLYSVITRDMNLYGTRLCRIPTPRFLVFYNGEDEIPEEETLLLSSAFEVQEEKPSLELKVQVLNINKGYNEKMKSACKALADYTEYTARVRKYAKEMPIEKAVEKALTECIQEGIMAEFLSENRAEAIKVSIYEYDEEKHMRQEREQHWQEGMVEGRKEGMVEGRKEGMVEGRKEGITEGRKEGITEGHKQVFKKMLENGYTKEEAQRLSELTDEQALGVLGELQK